MYKLSRVLLAIAMLEFMLIAAIATITWWPWSGFAWLAVVVSERIKNGRNLWAHGTARWASEHELRRAGMIEGNKGLYIGRMADPGPLPWMANVMAVLNPRIGSKAACDYYLARAGMGYRRRKGKPVRVSKTPHTLVCGPTGAGKGASFIIPWLQNVDESAVVLDFKGENASITARLRERKFRHRTVLLDPFHVVTSQPDCLNPIDFIDQASRDAIDDCRDLAEQLVLRTGEEREPHWNDGAEMFIGGSIVAVVRGADRSDRSLQTVRDVLTNPNNIPKLIELLAELGGMVARFGGQLAFFRDKELASVLTTVNRHMRFLDTPAVADSTSASSFDPHELRNGKMTVYCILPPEHMRAQSALIRMWFGTLMRCVVRGGLQRG